MRSGNGVGNENPQNPTAVISGTSVSTLFLCHPPQEVEIATEKDKGSLLMSSIRFGNIDLFKRIERYVGRAVSPREQIQ